MDRETAIRAKQYALDAIQKLHSIFHDPIEYDFERNKALKRGIGLSIGSIEMDLLAVVYRQFPDLDDLKN